MNEIIIALLSLLGTIVGSLSGVLAANRLTNYRIRELEKKVEKHNTIVERTYRLEEMMKGGQPPSHRPGTPRGKRTV